MSRSVRSRAFAIPQTACLGVLTRRRLLERLENTSDLDNFGKVFTDDGGGYVSAELYRRSIMLSTRKERKRRKRDDASLTSRLDGLVGGLGLLCPAVPVSSQTISSRAKFADLS